MENRLESVCLSYTKSDYLERKLEDKGHSECQNVDLSLTGMTIEYTGMGVT